MKNTHLVAPIVGGIILCAAAGYSVFSIVNSDDATVDTNSLGSQVVAAVESVAHDFEDAAVIVVAKGEQLFSDEQEVVEDTPQPTADDVAKAESEAANTPSTDDVVMTPQPETNNN